MDKETLSNYGWIVICVLVLAVMLALASPFGNFVADAIKSTTQGLFNVNQSALNSTGLINIGNQSFESGSEDSTPSTPDPALNPTDIDLDSNGRTTPQNGDTYTHGDYRYTYMEVYNGWKVAINTEVTDKKQTSYGTILESINGKPVDRKSVV